jgi:hypothetical protein
MNIKKITALLGAGAIMSVGLVAGVSAPSSSAAGCYAFANTPYLNGANIEAYS